MGVVCTKVVVQRKGGDESILRGVVYMMKSRGPRTEPWRTPQEEVYKDEKVLLHLTPMQRDDNLSRT